ncbi:MAG: PPC domain-containing protein, partial [Phycisphaerae bacterium]
MRTSTAMLLIVATGLSPLAAGSAEAGVSISFGLNLARRPSPAPVVVARPVVVPRPVVVRTPVRVPVMVLPNNYTLSNLTGHAGMGRYFKIYVPAGQTYLTVLTEGGFGESDLYVARDYLPTPRNHQYASIAVGTYEEVSVLYPAAGDWYVLVHGAGSYADVSLLASWWQQEVYYEDQAYYVQPSAYANTQVYVYWDNLYPRRPAGGLIPYILSHLRDKHRARHRTYAPHPRPQGSHPRQVVHHRPSAPMRPQA